MTPARYKEILAKLGLTHGEAGLLFGHSQNDGQLWGKRGPPLVIAASLRILEDQELKPRDLARIMREHDEPFKALPYDLAVMLRLMEELQVGAMELDRIMREDMPSPYRRLWTPRKPTS
jgi:hypothetical protein